MAYEHGLPGCLYSYAYVNIIHFTFLNYFEGVDAFRSEMISETVLRRLLKQDVIQHIKLKGDEDKNDPKRYVFQEGKSVSNNFQSFFFFRLH